MPTFIINESNQQIVSIVALLDKILAVKKAASTGSATDASINSASVFQADTSQWEREIDRLVYKLYDLTEEEIRLVEGR